MPGVGRVLLCRCVHGELIPRAGIEKILGCLRDAGVGIDVVDDLCGLVARCDPRVRELAEAEAATVVACYPRAVKWLFAAADAPWTDGRVAVLNFREGSAESIVEAVLGRRDEGNDEWRMTNDESMPNAECRMPTAEATPGANRQDASSGLSDPDSSFVIRHSSFPASPASWVPWFPVVDYDRCTNCGQCLNFCLFGVFGRDGRGRVAVLRPAKCKTNCPACARVCPEAAIIFPKHGTPPINGADVRPEDLQRAKMMTDPSALARGDIYAALRKRGQGGGLAEWRERLGIPPEVLAGLPADALRARAQEALASQSPAEQVPPCDCDCHQPGTESAPCDCGKCLACTCDERRGSGG